MTVILGKATFTITRQSGAWEAGYFVEGAPTSFTLEGSLQPADGRDLSLLPEGSRSEAGWVLLCDEHQQALLVGDHVTAQGGDYLVMVVMDWMLHSPLPYRGYVLGEVTDV
jgi:hypothetical protein